MSFYNADCMELLKETPDKYYELAIVDPPYGIGVGGTVGGGSHLVKVGGERLSRQKVIGGLMIVNLLNKNTFKNYSEFQKIR